METALNAIITLNPHRTSSNVMLLLLSVNWSLAAETRAVDKKRRIQVDNTPLVLGLFNIVPPFKTKKDTTLSKTTKLTQPLGLISP